MRRAQRGGASFGDLGGQAGGFDLGRGAGQGAAENHHVVKIRRASGQAHAFLGGKRVGAQVFPAFAGHFVHGLGQGQGKAGLDRLEALGLLAFAWCRDHTVFIALHIGFPRGSGATIKDDAPQAKWQAAGAGSNDVNLSLYESREKRLANVP